MTIAEIAADLTWVVASIGDRRDIVVTCRHDVDQPPGRFVFARAEIVVDLQRLITPNATTSGPQWWLQHTRLLGVLLHELGHAEHTPRRAVIPELRAWVNLLEEPRVEAGMLTSHAHARSWLRESALNSLIVREPSSVADAVETLILSHGRIAAGILTADDVAAVAAPARTALGPPATTKLDALIAAGVALADDDLDGMVRIAAAIAGLVDEITAGMPTQPSVAGDHDLTTDLDGDQPNPDPRPSATDPHSTRDPARHDQPSAVSDPGIDMQHARRVSKAKPVTVIQRAPTHEEQRSAQQLGSWLTGPSTSQLMREQILCPTPPGRMRTSEVMRGEAQLDMGATVTAMPWTRTRVRPQETAPFEVGIIIDRSHSMLDDLDDIAGTAWVLGRALASSSAGRLCTWVFADFAEVLPPGTPARVSVPRVGRVSSGLPAALADYERWTKPGPGVPRVLTILSDGLLHGQPVAPILNRLEQKGTRIVWALPRSGGLTLHRSADTHVIRLGEDDLLQSLLSVIRS
ncbi:hypothetical protein [Gordonia alkanivorans]|uniref:hypothetical protein n=1 Tax=Gordonia alkanivorans TaxID=84096 RepID=UPI0005A902AD|nr:hypothetical protein [Gordonia alkanivorans]